MKKKIILAYSGGLDSSVVIPWLIENQSCNVIAVCVDVGQNVNFNEIKKRALKFGALACHVIDAKKQFIEDILWPILKSGAVYEDKYLLGTPAARILITKIIAEYARGEKAHAIAHGAKAKSIDFERFALMFNNLVPDIELIAPWQTWKLKSPEEELRYLTRRKLPKPEYKKNSYISDDNLWNVSHEGRELNDLAEEPQLKKILLNTVIPEKAQSKPCYVEIEFEKGLPVALNRKKMESLAIVKMLNKIGGDNGIGITDLIEKNKSGINYRRLYEAPGVSILYYAHKELEHMCLDRETYAFKQQAAFKMSEIVYKGLWFSSLQKALSAFADSTQKTVNGTVRLKFYRGLISSAGLSLNSSVNKQPAQEKIGKRK